MEGRDSALLLLLLLLPFVIRPRKNGKRRKGVQDLSQRNHDPWSVHEQPEKSEARSSLPAAADLLVSLSPTVLLFSEFSTFFWFFFGVLLPKKSF